MQILRARSFEREFVKLPGEIRERFVQKLRFFLDDPFHPSLQSKKMQGRVAIWEVRISQGYRFTFEKDGAMVTLRHIGTHDILNNP